MAVHSLPVLLGSQLPYVCDICDAKFYSRTTFIKHMEYHIFIRIYSKLKKDSQFLRVLVGKCTNTTNPFTSIENSSAANARCLFAVSAKESSITSTPDCSVQTQYICKDGVFYCIKCEKQYKFKGNIRRHLKYECGKSANFHCPLCDFKCKRFDYLKFHLNSKKHADVKLQPVLIKSSASKTKEGTLKLGIQRLKAGDTKDFLL
ncbi:hypothetical protein HUJ04_008572 [Dendroctonus ponderosae]|nr:hypothetical protein HUJ04_008572 [Dendroctonus ponderosae]